MLDGSEVWQAYRDQKHDLFLPAGASAKVRPALRALGVGAVLKGLEPYAPGSSSAAGLHAPLVCGNEEHVSGACEPE